MSTKEDMAMVVSVGASGIISGPAAGGLVGYRNLHGKPAVLGSEKVAAAKVLLKEYGAAIGAPDEASRAEICNLVERGATPHRRPSQTAIEAAIVVEHVTIPKKGKWVDTDAAMAWSTDLEAAFLWAEAYIWPGNGPRPDNFESDR